MSPTPASPQMSDMMTMGDEKVLVTPDVGGSSGIKEPSDSDVLCGRGGSINSHPGNERFRTLVEKRKRVYLTARFKREKRLIASSIVQEIRDLNPPGRFLLRDTKSGLWKDIGDEKARDKTSQALRENAPSIRAEIETEINEQRAELQASRSHDSGKHKAAERPPPPPSHAAPPYYGGGPGWGYQPYYGYSHHHAAPPPPPPGQYPPPPPPSSSYGGEGPPPPPPPHWGQHHPPPPYYGGPPPHPSGDPYLAHPHPPPAPKSTFEKTAEYVASGAESIKNWMGGSSASSAAPIQSSSSHDSRSVSSNSAHSKSKQPIVYVHHEGDSRGKRRMVKFRDVSKHRRKHPAPVSTHHHQHRSQQQHNGVPRPNYSPIHSNGSVNANSLLDGEIDEHEQQNPEVQIIEPHKLDSPTEHDPNSSLMTQFANQVLGSIGSWDAAATICGTADDEKPPFPDTHTSANPQQDVPQAATGDEEMNMEWEEGQEVQLLDQNSKPDYDSADERMPPPTRPSRPAAAVAAPDANQSLGFSSLGSCHSWLPEQFGSAAGSFFGGGSLTNNSRAAANGDTSASLHSMDMTHATPMEQYSAAGSIGGGSLTRVFENSTHDYSAQHMGQPAPANNMSHRELSQMPSWERSLRSRSPVSQVGSEDHDDQSLVSKTSSKMSEGLSAASHSMQQALPSPTADGGMVWETRE